mgnify:CR=1 FL=1
MRQVVIYAVGSPLVVDYEESLHRAEVGIVAAVRNVDGKVYFSSPELLIDRTAALRFTDVPFLVPLFGPGNRQFVVAEARAAGFNAAFDLVDPTAILPRRIEHGPGLYINAGVTIGAKCQFGEFTIVNRGATVGHDCTSGAFVSIGPGAVIAGNVDIGAGSVIGAGAIILPERRIGRNSVVAAGAVLTKDVPDNAMVAGNPAKIVKLDIAGYGGRSVDVA